MKDHHVLAPETRRLLWTKPTILANFPPPFRSGMAGLRNDAVLVQEIYSGTPRRLDRAVEAVQFARAVTDKPGRVASGRSLFSQAGLAVRYGRGICGWEWVEGLRGPVDAMTLFSEMTLVNRPTEILGKAPGHTTAGDDGDKVHSRQLARLQSYCISQLLS